MEFRILGPVEVHATAGVVELPGPKPRALLAMLLLHANEPVNTERLAVGLWGEEAPAGSIKTVRVHLSRLRRALGDAEVLTTTPAGYRIRVRPGELDSQRFEQLSEAGRQALADGQPERAAAVLGEALALWRGPALADFAAESFAQREIARLEELRVVAVEERFEAALGLGEEQALVADLERFVAEHPTRERLLGQLMRALYRSGRQADALEAYRRGRRRLDEELGLEVSPELHELEEAILRHDTAVGTATRQSRAPAASRAQIPVPLASMIGRQDDLRALETLVGQPDARLVTVIGPGGVGKTRLALALAHRVAHRFAAGSAFVSLADAPNTGAGGAAPVPGEPTSEQLVLTAIGRAVGAHEQAGQPLLASLTAHLEGKHMLLVLDNIEHLLAAAPAVVRLLVACEGLRVLVTSREALRVPGEREYPLAPLKLPEASQADPERLADNDAVALFVERARGVQPGFGLSTTNARAVAAICIALDGLPLALELAAARVKLLSPPAMLARLEKRLPMLTGGSRVGPEHQRTLAATIAWGYDLLGADDQRAFARLSVFRGGWPLEAAQEVCDADVETICSLVDKSLLRQTDDRLSMLQTIREYAEDRLSIRADATTIGRRHAEWVLGIFDEAKPHLYGRDQTVWLQRLDKEHENLQAALELARELGDHRLRFRLLASCWYYWYLRSRYAEGQAQLEAALPAVDMVELELRRELYNALFIIHWHQGGRERASDFAARSLQLRAALPEDFGLLQSLINAALPAQEAGDLLSTEKSMRECSALAARIGEPWGRAVALTNLSDIELQQGRFQDAAAHAAEGSSIFDDIGDSHGHATALNNLAAAELELMQTNAAIGHLTESLHEVGREDLADAYFGCIDGLAAAEASRGHAEAAARLLGFADAIRARTNFALQGFERVRRARTLAMLADQLDASAIADARADGAMLDLNEGVELALQTSS